MLPPAVPKVKARNYGEQGTTTGLDTKPHGGESFPTKKGLEIANKYDNIVFTTMQHAPKLVFVVSQH